MWLRMKVRSRSRPGAGCGSLQVAHESPLTANQVLHPPKLPSCVAKNRYGITEELPLSWAAFIQAMSNNQQQGANTDG